MCNFRQRDRVVSVRWANYSRINFASRCIRRGFPGLLQRWPYGNIQHETHNYVDRSRTSDPNASYQQHRHYFSQTTTISQLLERAAASVGPSSLFFLTNVAFKSDLDKICWCVKWWEKMIHARVTGIISAFLQYVWSCVTDYMYMCWLSCREKEGKLAASQLSEMAAELETVVQGGVSKLWAQTTGFFFNERLFPAVFVASAR